jgi:peptidoglycan hydrolase-like protein with peptidoglycan-binding domain
MLLASKVAWSGIVFIVVSTAISGPRPAPRRPAAANLVQEAPTVGHQNDARNTQHALQDRGHYRGKVDGAFGLRTRASVRAYQKAEKLPITGQIDVQTAAGLGVTPESAWGNSQSAGRDVGHPDKPSAGTKRTESRGSKTRHKEVSQAGSAIEDRGDKGANR